MPTLFSRATRRRSLKFRRYLLRAILVVLFLVGCAGGIQRAPAEEVSLSGPFAVRIGGSAQYSVTTQSLPSIRRRRT